MASENLIKLIVFTAICNLRYELDHKVTKIDEDFDFDAFAKVSGQTITDDDADRIDNEYLTLQAADINNILKTVHNCLDGIVENTIKPTPPTGNA